MEKATFGLDENIASALTYLLGFLTGIVFFLVEKDNKTVRFHAMQSIITFIALWVIIVIISFIPVIGMITPLFWILELILWLLLMIKAYQGEKFKLPVVGDMAEGYA